MRVRQCICMLAIAMLVAGCGSAERKANKSTAKMNEERMDLIDKYQKCVEKAGDNEEEAAACETYRKSAEALN